jgi:hypothetical protein
MIIRINKTEAIRAKISRDGYVTNLNEERHIAAIKAMNEQLKAHRSDFLIKDRKSEDSALTVILTD